MGVWGAEEQGEERGESALFLFDISFNHGISPNCTYKLIASLGGSAMRRSKLRRGDMAGADGLYA
jgi:hypothetical protein